MFRWSDSDLILFFVGRGNQSKRDSSTAQTGFFCLVDYGRLFLTPKGKYFNCEFGASASQEEKATSGCRLTEGFLLIPCPYGIVCAL